MKYKVYKTNYIEDFRLLCDVFTTSGSLCSSAPAFFLVDAMYLQIPNEDITVTSDRNLYFPC